MHNLLCLIAQRVPYDWKNPTAYLVTTLYQYVSLQRFLAFLGLGATLGIAGLVFGINLIRDMKAVLKSINDYAVAGEHNKKQALKKLNEFIEMHAMVKELSVIYNLFMLNKKIFQWPFLPTHFRFLNVFHRRMLFFSDTLEPFAAVIFVSSLATICCAMLMIQLELVELKWKLVSDFCMSSNLRFQI